MGATVSPASAQEATVGVTGDAIEARKDAVPGYPFKPGDVIGFEQLELIKDYIPEPFWENRDFFFFEGMKLEIGEFYKQYPISEGRKTANEKFGGRVPLACPRTGEVGRVRGQHLQRGQDVHPLPV